MPPGVRVWLATGRGWAGPSLLAMILFEKFGQHQPLNRQAERYAREGVPLSLSTLADQVGAGCAVLEPILGRIEAHVLAAERLHGDDTTVPVLAQAKLGSAKTGKTDTGRCWVYVRDDRPFGGTTSPIDQRHERRAPPAVRQDLSMPLVADLEVWTREQRAKLSRGNDTDFLWGVPLHLHKNSDCAGRDSALVL